MPDEGIRAKLYRVDYANQVPLFFWRSKLMRRHLILLFLIAVLFPGLSPVGAADTEAKGGNPGLTLYYTGNNWGYLEPCPS